MNYQEVENFLFNSFADFQKYGQSALIYDLSNISHLCEALGNPQSSFKSIHIAGTNGKGSTSHMMASVLQEAGYKVGLYTSPHLKSYTERIKINGVEINKDFIVEFVSNNFDLLNSGKYSFFEITTVLSFVYFAKQNIDIAVVEVGLGGRLDATNIIVPVLSIITNIALDHTQILGNTINEIAKEKAGIIKHQVPVVINEYTEETHSVFSEKADAEDADIFFASKLFDLKIDENSIIVTDRLLKQSFEIILDLKGQYQLKNVLGVIQSVKVLNNLGFKIKPEYMLEGLSKVKINTNLKGRWQILQNKPLIVCDTAHNEAGLKELISQIVHLDKPTKFIVNFSKEKELSKLVELFPVDAQYFTCEVDNPRMRTAVEIRKAFASIGISAQIFQNVNQAIKEVSTNCREDAIVMILGSNFLIAEIENL